MLANGTPLMVKKVLGNCRYPVDGDWNFSTADRSSAVEDPARGGDARSW